jgi:hypothetical protein
MKCSRCQNGAPGYVCAGCIDKLIVSKSKGGRPPAPPGLRRVNVPLRLPEWLVQWMAEQPETPAELIEAALLKAHKLRAPRAP